MSANDTPSERRRFPRLAAPLYARPARLRRVEKQQVLDASLGGIRIYSDDLYADNSPLELDLFLKDGTSLRCHARVAWTKKLPAGEVARFEVGLAFTDVEPDVLDQLKTVLVPEDEGSPDSP
ncbi:PilZ domain-containing protein [Pyxidicoccus xibeiensis]|uniref:PilZ domain-containing protein n=1 Tax=Pyxidicoccus xibeiensis TaxID=2906759 RepID=UPI0020A703F8|nr:PilZ domain-containing protein [Pyxidicoccus xibeiensis]MCP3135952.1 PilZ domain-containing protein [Pyxidicoccus xibeiensis]